MNIRAYFHKLREKMIREPLPPDKIAGGWALGMFVGCAVPFGFQLVVSIPLALMMRVSKVGATVATFITNPVTIFFIYPAQTFVVNTLLFGGTLSYGKLRHLVWTWQTVRDLGVDALVSFLLGGLILGLILSPLTYFFVKRVVVTHRNKKIR